jgi:hypothetical protein
MITALCERRIPAVFSAWSSPGRASPPMPNAPMRRKLRREIPSQNPDRSGLGPRIVSMGGGVALESEPMAFHDPPSQVKRA